MALKTDLRRILRRQLKISRERIASEQEVIRNYTSALAALHGVNLGKAEYRVILTSGSASVNRTSHRGSLETAVKKAEAGLKEKTHVGRIVAEYDVSVRIGSQWFSIPERYWKGFVSGTIQYPPDKFPYI